MIGKFGKKGSGREFSLKSWVATFLFGAIIVVFALWGVRPDRFGDSAGGVAATVNETSISLAEYKGHMLSIEQGARSRLEQFPEAQRKMITMQLQQRALDDLIMSEVIYQAASQRGVRATDAEVRDSILQIPFFNENGRFLRDRYRNYLANQGLTSEDFERQIRKHIVTQRIQELFTSSANPAREEIRRNQLLANQKVNLRFVDLNRDDFKKPGFFSDNEVKEFASNQAAQIEKYYGDNAIEFTDEERIQARHILIRTDDKRNDDAAKKLASEVRAQVNAKNFAELAARYSDDPGSKVKGGELGEFGRGRMVPEFEKAAFSLNENQISDPIKTNFGYHIILVEKRTQTQHRPLAQVRDEIARKLLARDQQNSIVEHLRNMLQKGSLADLENWVKQTHSKWVETGEFDLATSNIPKLGEDSGVISAVLRQGRKSGLVHDLIESNGRFVIADVISWKESTNSSPAIEGLEQNLAQRKSADIVEAWAKDIQSAATIQRNPRLMQ